jgi:NADP-dependent 3-hydroxy acid dehydrogenase YdfG
MSPPDPHDDSAAAADDAATSPVVIVGAGPGIGMAVARRFGAAGHPVGLIARKPDRLDQHVAELRAYGIPAAAATADVLEPDQLRGALSALNDELGAAQVLCFSPFPNTSLIKPVAETSGEDISAALRLNAVGSATAAAQLLPGLKPGATLLFVTGGAAVDPNPNRAVSAVTYAAEVTYARLLHDALAPDIHVGVTTVVGPVGLGKRHEPAQIAEHLYRHHTERREFQQTIR